MTDPFSKPNLSALRPGMRLAVRHRLDGAAPGDGGTTASLTDTVGELVEISENDLVVRTRHALVRVPATTVTAVREIPPRAARPGPRHRVIASADLQRLGLLGLPPLRQESLGDWVLRASDGVTYRGNSALILGDSGHSADESIDRLRTFYAEQGTVPLAQVADDVPGIEDLRAALAADGWVEFQQTVVMTAPSLEVAGRRIAVPGLSITDTVGEDWFTGAADRERTNEPVLTRMLSGVRDGRYAQLRLPDGRLVAVGRTAASPRWAGIFSVHVDPAHRGRGHGRALMEALATDAAARGAESLYLQVTSANTPAISLYQDLGFEVHHTYRYASPGGVELG